MSSVARPSFPSRPLATLIVSPRVHARLRKEELWGCRVEKEIESRTQSEVEVHRKDGTSETKLVKVLWTRNGPSPGNFVEY